MSEPAGREALAERTAQHFPWYRQLQAREGGAPRSLPLITAPVLEAYYYTEDNPLARGGDLYRYRTSGTSSGLRKTIYYSERDEADYLRIKLDVFRQILGNAGYRTAASDMGTGHAEATAASVFRSLGMEVHTLSFREPIGRHIEELKRIRPEVLYTMPSILDRILLAADDPLAFGVRRVILVGEIAAPGWIRHAAEKLGIGPDAVADTYGSIEIGTIAYYDRRHGRYVLTEGLEAEGVGAEALGEGYEPLPAGEQVLVLTSYVREAFPALRYVTYDVVRDLRPIVVDGERRQSFRSIVKRIGPDLKHGEKISIYDIEDAVYRHIRDASVRVNVAGNALRVHLHGANADQALLGRVREELQDRIPEIGAMIRGGMLAGIEVVAEPGYDDERSRGSVKNKKIFYT
ncbi:CoF synthetase [Cohnella sp. JJ-181]|uniref:CoF synthetase n=1 Tax=Cohnella rhizoplanae TaxID=2974897 RepID=UPI0022FF9E02|nr:CoF synthetase [Cohnella sp. JJ-181]CAI6074763.1 Fumarate--(S)-2,3-diaminopropanoate ligase [Cohnella sp. JJ-181]